MEISYYRRSFSKSTTSSCFYLNGINFSLRGGKEHRELKWSQLVREKDCWKYVEHGSKCFRGGVGDLNRENKVVYQYPVSCTERCHVRLLDIYFSKLPRDTKNVFYCKPLKETPNDSTKPWFTAVPVGWNKLDSMVNSIFLEVSITGKSNHSLRVTSTTCMYKCGIPEKTIQSRTGHKSIEALRIYERPGPEQHSSVPNEQKEDEQAATSVVGCQSMSQSFQKMTSNTPVFNFNNCSVTLYTGNVNQSK